MSDNHNGTLGIAIIKCPKIKFYFKWLVQNILSGMKILTPKTNSKKKYIYNEQVQK